MALLDVRKRQAIQEVVDRWRERCLLEDGSLLFDDEQVWTPENLALLYHNVIEAPLEDERSFLEKYREQLRGSRELVLLGAEAMAVYYLFVWIGAVTAQTKRERLNEVLSWAGEQLDAESAIWRAFAEGIGHPGQYFLVRMELQIGFIVDFARRLKEQPVERRLEILDDPWQLRDFMDAGADEATTPGMRHVLLHLLQPDYFERIASGSHKQSIASTYAGFVGDGVTDLDEQLLAIRERLEELLKRPRERVDFYEPPLGGTWGAGRSGDGTDPLDALELQKQLVIFGPPGTSKTYEAKQLAKQIIRRAAMRQWGPVAYFERQPELEQIVDAHVRRLQLHPAYSYEEFIRGLRLRDGRTVYEDGYLLRLVDEISRETATSDQQTLPWVLILDELNRADLSRVFGEAFSALEDRESPVELPGAEPEEPVSTLQLPGAPIRDRDDEPDRPVARADRLRPAASLPLAAVELRRRPLGGGPPRAVAGDRDQRPRRLGPDQRRDADLHRARDLAQRADRCLAAPGPRLRDRPHLLLQGDRPAGARRLPAP